MKNRKEEIKTRPIDESTILAIHVKDEATYYIRSKDIEHAKELAMDWFSERTPTVEIKAIVEDAIYEDK